MEHRSDYAFSLNQLYATAGLTKQAVHKYRKRQDEYDQ